MHDDRVITSESQWRVLWYSHALHMEFLGHNYIANSYQFITMQSCFVASAGPCCTQVCIYYSPSRLLNEITPVVLSGMPMNHWDHSGRLLRVAVVEGGNLGRAICNVYKNVPSVSSETGCC